MVFNEFLKWDACDVLVFKGEQERKKNKKQHYEESEHLMGIYGYPSPNVIPPPKSSRLYEGITVFDTLISIS